MKPLHYLREGTIYLFEVPDAESESGIQPGHRLEHYWLCGDCCIDHLLERTADKELRLVPKRTSRFVRRAAPVNRPALAS